VKYCNKCNTDKSIDEFNADKKAKDGKSYYCKACKKASRSKTSMKKYKQTFRKKNPLKVRLSQVWVMYKLDADTYLEMVSKGCAVCGSMENLCVDHDHSCCEGKYSCGQCVRGILCRSCNQAEGFLKSNSVLVRKLADYLER
jgi:hypothetical protein